MIDPHAHLRDWGQAEKETLRHGLAAAWSAGLDGVFEMPNTDPPLTGLDAIRRRIADADAAVSSLGAGIFHGLYAGLTPEPSQIAEAVSAWRALFPRVVGLKMFAGHSTGNMGILGRERQERVFAELASLNYTGVLSVHAEKEELFAPAWDSSVASSHALARPPRAEVESVRDQIEAARAAGFRGTLHIVHVSVPEALDLVLAARRGGMTVTAGIAPHHALLDAAAMDGPSGMLLKMNPPLRPSPLPEVMMHRLLAGDIDWVETDHAPHTLEDKTLRHASGIPGFPFYPRFIRILRARGMSETLLQSVTHGAICAAFRLDIPDRRRTPDDAALRALAQEYPWDPFAGITF